MLRDLGMATPRKYKVISAAEVFSSLNSEEEARQYLWISRYGRGGFKCPQCGGRKFWEHQARAEIRECVACKRQVRLRAGSVFEHSKISLLNWVRGLHFVMQDKRGISALTLQRLLGLGSYRTAWLMLMKIRKALADRDAEYKIEGLIELDGAYFNKAPTSLDKIQGKKHPKHSVLMAVERKDWTDEKGKKKSKAGFAKVMIDMRGDETKKTVDEFVRQNIKPRSFVRTDGKSTYKNLPGVASHVKTISGLPKEMDSHLPWVSKFISNAKTWLLGTHHGIESKYLSLYLAEYTYRFNRRHDPNGLFDRAVRACLSSTPSSSHALCA